MSSQHRLLSSAKLIALCTLLSRVTGLARDMLLLQFFGLRNPAADAINFAFQFPNLFRRLFGEGALAAVFVPTFTKTLEKDGRPAAWRLLARTLALLTITLSGLVVLLELILLVIWLLSPADAPRESAARELLLGLTALMLPFMLSICVLALLSSILNCLGSFVPAALVPIVLNLVMIAALVWGQRQWPADDALRAYIVGGSVLIAGVLQILLIWPALRRRGVPLGWALEPRDPQVRGVLRLMGPVLLGQGVLLVSTFLDTFLSTLLTAEYRWLGDSFPYPLRQGALSALANAARLYQFPLGVLVISLATAALPAFSRRAARADWAGWASEVRMMLRLAVFEGLLAGGLMIVLAEPIVRLLFQYRNFDAADTSRSAHVLMWYGFGLWAFCAQHILTRAFYSLGDVKTPLRIAAGFMPLNLAVGLALVWLPSVRESAFAIASVVASSLSVLVGIAALRGKTAPGIAQPELVGAIARMLAAIVATAFAVNALRPAWNEIVEQAVTSEFVRRAADALGGLALGTMLFLLLAAMLRLPEVGMLLRFRGRPAASADATSRAT